jgi:hypothetical protein
MIRCDLPMLYRLAERSRSQDYIKCNRKPDLSRLMREVLFSQLDTW